MGNAVFCFTDIISTPYPAHSVVPSSCRATLERRLLPASQHPGEVREVLEQAILEACQAAEVDAQLTLAQTRYTSYRGHAVREEKWFPAWQMQRNSPLVRAAQQGLQSVGQAAPFAAYRFCTNGAWSAGVAGIPTIGYGPSHEGMAHIVDEYLELDQLRGAGEGYRAIAQSVLRPL